MNMRTLYFFTDEGILLDDRYKYSPAELKDIAQKYEVWQEKGSFSTMVKGTMYFTQSLKR